MKGIWKGDVWDADVFWTNWVPLAQHTGVKDHNFDDADNDHDRGLHEVLQQHAAHDGQAVRVDERSRQDVARVDALVLGEREAQELRRELLLNVERDAAHRPQRERRQHDQHGDQTRRYQEADRIDSHDLQRVDFLADRHRADPRSER